MIRARSATVFLLFILKSSLEEPEEGVCSDQVIYRPRHLVGAFGSVSTVDGPAGLNVALVLYVKCG